MNPKTPYDILYEDEEIIVVYKKRDVFTVATNDKRTFHHNLFYYLGTYLKRKGEKPYIIHRLDFETSGILIFAKSHEKQVLLRSLFQKRIVERDYEAVVLEHIPLDFQKEVIMFLKDDKDGSRVEEDENGKEAITLVEASNYIHIGTALKINIRTGRRNQIRLAIHHLGLTLLGDKRYSHNENKRMYLNCYHLSFPKEAKLRQSDFSTVPLWVIEKKNSID